MPPRIPTPTTTSIITTISRSSISPAKPSIGTHLVPSCPQQTTSFSTTASRSKFSKGRRDFREWIARRGAVYRKHTPGQTTYIKPLSLGAEIPEDQPFHLNPSFRSTPVLDDGARELIWSRVMRNGETIKAVSAEFGVDIRRVAAIVRLKEVEKDWEAKGKKLAKPYANAVLSMLPTWQLNEGSQSDPFEPINELHVHPYTMQQLFWPTSESRHFTREDAAKAFHNKMLSADARVPHPELIQMERDLIEGSSPSDAAARFKQAAIESERKAAEKQVRKAAREEKSTTRINTDRFEFRFKQYNAEENVGPKGRDRRAVGWRYGVPYFDRSKGHQIKIPTSVP